MSLNLKGSTLTGVGTQGFVYFPLYPCNSRVMHLFSCICTQQFCRNSCLQLKMNPLLCFVLMFLSFCGVVRVSPCSFSEEIITRMGSLSRIQADALHQSYSAICHRDTIIRRLLFQAKNSFIIPSVVSGKTTLHIVLSMAPQYMH